MKEQLVEFETAKLAKEKGFDEYTDRVYLTKDNIKMQCGMRNYPESIFPGVIKAPTKSELQKWLREEHNIHVEIQSPDDTQESWRSHIRYINKYGNRGDCGDSKSFEEALEKVLVKALKLVE